MDWPLTRPLSRCLPPHTAGAPPLQDAKSQRWFIFNDERVLPMPDADADATLQNACGSSNHRDARRPCAYILLYRRKGS